MVTAPVTTAVTRIVFQFILDRERSSVVVVFSIIVYRSMQLTVFLAGGEVVAGPLVRVLREMWTLLHEFAFPSRE